MAKTLTSVPKSETDNRELYLIRLECLKIIAEMKISNDVELLESRAEHFFNWIVNGGKR